MSDKSKEINDKLDKTKEKVKDPKIKAAIEKKQEFVNKPQINK